jgi:hypothetical protein
MRNSTVARAFATREGVPRRPSPSLPWNLAWVHSWQFLVDLDSSISIHCEPGPH